MCVFGAVIITFDWWYQWSECFYWFVRKLPYIFSLFWPPFHFLAVIFDWICQIFLTMEHPLPESSRRVNWLLPFMIFIFEVQFCPGDYLRSLRGNFLLMSYSWNCFLCCSFLLNSLFVRQFSFCFQYFVSFHLDFFVSAFCTFMQRNHYAAIVAIFFLVHCNSFFASPVHSCSTDSIGFALWNLC